MNLRPFSVKYYCDQIVLMKVNFADTVIATFKFFNLVICVFKPVQMDTFEETQGDTPISYPEKGPFPEGPFNLNDSRLLSPCG